MNSSEAKNYRPIIVSNTLSKIFELCLLESCYNLELDPSQFGFVSGRSTTMAAATVHDVFNYSNNQGSNVYACSLDAEGDFDQIPHVIIFQKLRKVISDDWWRCVYVWYTNNYC